MKKLLFIFIGAMALSTSSASAQALGEGGVSIDAYYGFPNLYNTSFQALYSDGDELNLNVGGIGPVGIRAEYMLADKFGIGVDVSFSSAKVGFDFETSVYNETTNEFDQVTYSEEVRTSKISAMATFNYHFIDNDKVDFYAMFGAGYKNRNFAFSSNDPAFDEASANVSVTLIPVALRLALGVRYFLTDNIGLSMQLGFGHSGVLNGGLAFKF